MGTIIAIILLVISLIGMGVIVVRKFPQLTIVEVESMKSEREAQIKRDILVQRLKRIRYEKFIKFLKTLAPLFGPFGKKIKKSFSNLYQRYLDLEKRHKKAIIEKKETPSGRLGILIEEARDLTKKEDLSGAEEKYLEAIQLDYKNVDSYEGLGEIYLRKKEYKEAKETFQFVLKLDPDRADIYFDLSQASVGLGEGDKAIEYLEKALEFEPNNPKYLDYLIEVSIMSKNYKSARTTLERLKEVNPENQKIKDFEVRIKTLR